MGFPLVDKPTAGLAADVPNPELLLKLLGAGGTLVAGAPNPAVAPNPVEGVLGAVKLLVGVVVCAPPLFAPAIFSWVRPNAAIPNTAPIAIWNNPAPCRVNGFHCVIDV